MKIKNDRLHHDDDKAVDFVLADKVGGDIQHEYIVMHYTANGAAEKTIKAYASENARASAHIVIDRDGSISQHVRFNKAAWHAGRSSWKNRKNGLNNYSIGIQLANWGMLTEANGVFRSYAGAIISPQNVIHAPHRHAPHIDRYWEVFPEAQMDAAAAVVGSLVDHYDIPGDAILGHDDIAPGRKVDPGPAFNMPLFRARVMGSADNVLTETENFEVDANIGLNLRSGPSLDHQIITVMPKHTKLYRHLGEERGRWWLMTKLNDEGEQHMTGYIYSHFVTAI